VLLYHYCPTTLLIAPYSHEIDQGLLLDQVHALLLVELAMAARWYCTLYLLTMRSPALCELGGQVLADQG